MKKRLTHDQWALALGGAATLAVGLWAAWLAVRGQKSARHSTRTTTAAACAAQNAPELPAIAEGCDRDHSNFMAHPNNATFIESLPTHKAFSLSENLEMISDLAFQSQLLALHAAFEAARAGTPGRSLAVIAAEMRRVSQRCGEAAKELKILIDTTPPSVDPVRLASADHAMKLLIDSIQRVSELITIASATGRDERPILYTANHEGSLRDRQALIMAQVASTTRTMEARAKLICKAVATLGFKVDTAARQTPLTDAGEGPVALDSTPRPPQ